MKTPTTLSLFVRCLQKVHDPRSKQGQSHPFSTVLAAVDGKTDKQIKDEDGNLIHMLNVFAQTIKLPLASWQVNGNDQTNEPGCLKQHLEELFEMYPCLQLLTGDAIFADRSLLKTLREYNRDYLVQVKGNQPKVFTKMKEVFHEVTKETSHHYDHRVNKKRGL